MEGLGFYCRRAIELGIDEAKPIDPRSIATAEWVRIKCQFGCPGFGRSLCCPPHTPGPDVTRKVIDSYNKVVLLHQRLAKGEKDRGAKAKAFNANILRLEIEIFLDGYYKSWSMGSGPCCLCKECDPSTLCKNGSRARPSMEACGIDVFQTARINGFPINVLRDHEEEKNVYGVILVE